MGPEAKWSIYWLSGLSMAKPECFDFRGYIEISESGVSEADQKAVRKLCSVCLSLYPLYINSNEKLAQGYPPNVKSSASEQIYFLYVYPGCASNAWGGPVLRNTFAFPKFQSTNLKFLLKM